MIQLLDNTFNESIFFEIRDDDKKFHKMMLYLQALSVINVFLITVHFEGIEPS